jgi:endonuclease-3
MIAGMDNQVIHKIFEILREVVETLQVPIVGKIAGENDPFKVLISTMLSLRTKDSTTEQACSRLFALASTPEKMVRTSIPDIEKAIYPVGFYKTKAVNIKGVSSILLKKYGGKIPSEMDSLLALPGVGRKTANLVLILGFDKMGICVDTHVHRITNRWGYVTTRTPDETELKLREILPGQYWKRINDYLVPYGQNICTPISPFCSKCRLLRYCERVKVTTSR